MKDLSDRVSYVISQYDGSQVDLANAIGITKSAVGQWKNGHIKNIRPNNLFALAHATGFSAEWIGTGKGNMRELDSITDEEKQVIEAYRTASDSVKFMLKTILEASETENISTSKAS